jgi:multiple antibiotic resistance protein
MNFAATGDVLQISTTVAAFLVLCIITYLFFVFGERLVHYLGAGALNAITRLMGMILAVVGTQMVIDGISGFVTSPTP